MTHENFTDKAAGSVQPPMRLPVFLLVVLAGIGPFSMIAVAPLIPTLTADFNTSYGTAQLVLSVYFALFAIAQLVLGPLSDRFGRRPVMLVAVASFAVGALASWLAPSIEVMILGRCLQAMGAAAGQVLTRVVLFDVYGRERSATLIGYLTIAMVLGPMFAPAIAGLFAETVGWRYLFLMMLGVSVAAWFGVVRFLPETRWVGVPVGAKPQGFFDGLPLLKNRKFLALAGNWAFGAAIYFAFLAGAAHVVIEEMGYSAVEYGAYFIGGGIGFMLGNLLSARFSVRLGLVRFIQLGTLLAMLTVLTQWTMLSVTHPLFVFLPMYGVAVANGLVLPNVVAMIMAVVPRLSGAASGLAGFLQIGCAAVVSWLVGYFPFFNSFTMVIVMNGCAALAVICLMLMPRDAAR